MKRKITELEKRLIYHGYKLSHKNYTKDGKRIKNYVYSELHQGKLECLIQIIIDPTREKVLDFMINTTITFFDCETMDLLNAYFDNLKDEVNWLTENKQFGYIEDDFTEEVEEVLKGECEDESRE